MWFGVVTLFPDMFEIIRREGVIGRALTNNLVKMALVDPRDFTSDKHRTVDDRPYGGGPGMIMMVEPLRSAIRQAKSLAPRDAKVIYLTPSGKTFTHSIAREYVRNEQPLILVAGRYEGIDQRVIEHDIDETLSLGDYVLSGGELAAMVIMDAMIRWIPGTLGHNGSALQDAFCEEQSGILDCPHYTRPACLDDQRVPEVLLTGDHQAIARWRRKQALGQTWRYRPDLLVGKELDKVSQALLAEFLDEERR